MRQPWRAGARRRGGETPAGHRARGIRSSMVVNFFSTHTTFRMAERSTFRLAHRMPSRNHGIACAEQPERDLNARPSRSEQPRPTVTQHESSITRSRTANPGTGISRSQGGHQRQLGNCKDLPRTGHGYQGRTRYSHWAGRGAILRGPRQFCGDARCEKTLEGQLQSAPGSPRQSWSYRGRGCNLAVADRR